jgi:hypothetical protein
VPYDNTGTIFHTIRDSKLTVHSSWLKDISLPFESQFALSIKPSDEDEKKNNFFQLSWDEEDKEKHDSVECIFLREYSPSVITGTIWFYFKYNSINAPFTIWVKEGKLVMDLKGWLDFEDFQSESMDEGYNAPKEEEKRIFYSKPLHPLVKVIKCLTNLPKHSVATDTPKHAEYYTRKHGSTIKAIKPIYYVLDKKEEKEKRNYNRIKPLGSIAFDHSFKVIGHWRKISPHTYGKNRNGEYVVTGMTWVKEHTRGEGDLIKKIRVVK